MKARSNKKVEENKPACSWSPSQSRNQDGSLERSSPEAPFLMRTLFKTLVLPHVDYCSQLWAPSRASDLLRLEKIQKNFLRKIPSLSHLSYWEQLASLKMYSTQRRLERHRVIYIWKLIEGIVPDCGVRESQNQETRLGRRAAATNGPGRTTLTAQTL